ncbi:MAG: hypothetical protein M5R41_00250 [Bacteroidia bacterium]|nr:hypothetical protein [Bacteroidia bacterium]
MNSFRFLLALLLLAFVGHSVNAQIGVLKVKSLDQSTPKLGDAAVPLRLQDMDRDGTPELVLRGQGTYSAELSGGNGTWELDYVWAGMSDPRYLGALRMTETSGPATHGAFIDATGFYLCMLNNKNPELTRYEVVTSENMEFFTMRRLGSGHEVAVIANGENLYVIGATDRFRSPSAAVKKQSAATASQLVQKYTGAVGEMLGYDPRMFPTEGAFDYDGDGIDELPLLNRDTNGIPTGLSILGGDSFDEVWSWKFPPAYLERITMGFHGFADVDDDGMKEFYCGDNIIVSRDGSVREVRDRFRILHLLDVDGDGVVDIVGRDEAENRIIALGKGTSTAVHALPVPGLATLHAPYPNPGRSGSMLSFTLAHPAPVNLSLHDALGRRVRTIATGVYDRGRHYLDFPALNDAGTELAAGSYTLMLSVGSEVLRRGFIITR